MSVNFKNKAVIFDMDGLMFDTERVCVDAWNYAGEKLGLGKTGYMVLKTLGINANAAREVWFAEFGERYDEQAIRKYSDEFLKEYYAKNKVPVKKGLYELLEYLKMNGYKLAVASSTGQCGVEAHLKDAGIFEYFGAIVCGDMVERSKPEPEIYLKACEMLGEKPCDCYALEDSRNGLLSAYRAGCKPIMVPDLWEPTDEILKIIVAKFDNLDGVREYFKSRKPLKLLYGTKNPAKIDDMRRRLQTLDVDIIGLNDVDTDIPDIAEDGKSPLENAEKKALGYFAAFKTPVFSCDSGLYIDGLPDDLQPGVHVRTVNGKYLNDDEMLAYYSELAEKYGDLTARYKNAICFVQDDEHIYSAMDNAMESEPFIITSKPHPTVKKGFPLDSLSVDIGTKKYYYDLTDDREKAYNADDGFLQFFKKHIT